MTTGTGIFSWDGFERRSDRYGSFTIDKNGYSGNGTYDDAKWDDVEQLQALVGKRVKITASVIESRESAHAGDIYRGIYPSRPENGETIVLGIGKLFTQITPWSISGLSIGVEPDDGRPNDWFEPAKLYRLHDQTVTITVTETDEESLRHEIGSVDEEGTQTSTIIITNDDDGAFMQYKGKFLGWITL